MDAVSCMAENIIRRNRAQGGSIVLHCDSVLAIKLAKSYNILIENKACGS